MAKPECAIESYVPIGFKYARSGRIRCGYEEKTKRDRVSNLIEDEKKKVIERDVGIIFKVLKPGPDRLV